MLCSGVNHGSCTARHIILSFIFILASDWLQWWRWSFLNIVCYLQKFLFRITQEFISEKGIGFVRIDGNTLPRDRQSAVHSFQLSNEVCVFFDFSYLIWFRGESCFVFIFICYFRFGSSKVNVVYLLLYLGLVFLLNCHSPSFMIALNCYWNYGL